MDLFEHDCNECQHFKPNQIGSKAGLGQCAVYEWVKRNQPKQESAWFARLGGKLFWGSPGRNRNCEKFKSNQ